MDTLKKELFSDSEKSSFFSINLCLLQAPFRTSGFDPYAKFSHLRIKPGSLQGQV